MSSSIQSIAAAGNDAAYTAGVVIGRLLFFVVGGVLLFVGLRRRTAARSDPSKKNGNGLIIAGSIVLGLAVLALASLAAMQTSR